MDNSKELEARITRLERELVTQQRKFGVEIKKLVESHTHTLGGTVVWKMPPEKLQEMLEGLISKLGPLSEPVLGQEKVKMTDNLSIEIKEVQP